MSILWQHNHSFEILRLPNEFHFNVRCLAVINVSPAQHSCFNKCNSSCWNQSHALREIINPANCSIQSWHLKLYCTLDSAKTIGLSTLSGVVRIYKSLTSRSQENSSNKTAVDINTKFSAHNDNDHCCYVNGARISAGKYRVRTYWQLIPPQTPGHKSTNGQPLLCFPAAKTATFTSKESLGRSVLHIYVVHLSSTRRKCPICSCVGS